ncbi:MAG: alpha/beta hydrolase [Chlorobi bacterium]|nr:alpha/beta hydrolase [Chlorobiota bacterium]
MTFRRSFQYKKTEISYLVLGTATGEPILMLHGMLGTFERELACMVPYFSDYQLVCPDIPAHGASTGATLDPRHTAEAMIALCEHLALPRVHVFGYSFGGFVGLMMAERRPDVVNALMMHATRFFWTQPEADEFAANLRPEVLAENNPRWVEVLREDHAPQGADHWKELCSIASTYVATLPESMSTFDVSTIATPVCVSCGDRDAMLPIREVEQLAGMLPCGSLAVIPGSAHPMQETQTGALAGVALELFRAHSIFS